MQATDIRNGMIVLFNGDLCRIMEFRHHTPGNLRAMVQVKLRNLRTGSQFEHRFRSGDQVEQAFIEHNEMEFLYADAQTYHFMNTENYDQVEISGEELGEAAKWLSAGLKIQVQFYEGRPMGVDLPKTITSKIVETQPLVKGGTASASYKPAILENGVTVQIPPFIGEGEEIVVDPIDNRYIERAK
ncbi:MAG: elongation factor P [Acidobacteriota bacterium]